MAERAGGDAPSQGGPKLRRRQRRLLLAGVVVLFIAWGAVAATIGLGGRTHLQEAERTLPLARDAVAAADFELASSTVRDAHRELTAASRAFDHPLLVPLRIAPIVRHDLQVARSIADGGRAVTEGVIELVDAVESQPGGLDGLKPADGTIPVQRIERLAPSLRRTTDAVAAAVVSIGEARPSGYVAEVTEGRTRVLDLIGPLVEQTERATLLAEQLPLFLGSDRPRNYLFGASTPAELRGTGGFIGSIASLTIDGGNLDFGDFEQASDLPTVAPTAIPPPVPEDAARWSRYGGTGLWVNLNRTPDFPTAAQAMLRHLEVTQDRQLDGMIVADPFALRELLALTGPAEVPAYDVTLDEDSVIPFVTNEAYAAFDETEERQSVLGAVAAATFARFLQGDIDVPTDELIAAFGALIEAGHLQAFAADPTIQEALAEVGMTGELGRASDTAGDLVHVALNSGSASKIDYYLDRRATIDIALLEDGSSRGELTLELTNEAPDEGQPSYVIGPNAVDLEAGESLLEVSVYLASGARFEERPARADGPTFEETALGHPVHDGWVRLPSGRSVERHYAWRTPDAWQRAENGDVIYDLLVQNQIGIRAMELTIDLAIPDDLELVDPPARLEVRHGEATWTDDVRGEDVHLQLRLRPVGRS